MPRLTPAAAMNASDRAHGVSDLRPLDALAHGPRSERGDPAACRTPAPSVHGRGAVGRPGSRRIYDAIGSHGTTTDRRPTATCADGRPAGSHAVLPLRRPNARVEAAVRFAPAGCRRAPLCSPLCRAPRGSRRATLRRARPSSPGVEERHERRAATGRDLRAAGGRSAAASPWYRWGPYVSERQWGTVREDYSADGNAWDYLPHDQRARARTAGARTGSPGSATSSSSLCLGLALWNGTDPILKERIFGLTGPGQPRRGREGVLVVPRRRPEPRLERWRYHYPQAAFPYERPGRGEPRAATSRTPSTSCSTPASSTTTATGRSRPTTRRPTRRPAAGGRGHATPGPSATRCTCCRRRGSATPGPGTTARSRPVARGSTGDAR